MKMAMAHSQKVPSPSIYNDNRNNGLFVGLQGVDEGHAGFGPSGEVGSVEGVLHVRKRFFGEDELGWLALTGGDELLQDEVDVRILEPTLDGVAVLALAHQIDGMHETAGRNVRGDGDGADISSVGAVRRGVTYWTIVATHVVDGVRVVRHVEHTALEATLGCQIHVLGVAHLRAINVEVVAIDVGFDGQGDAPDAVGVTLHGLWCSEHFALQRDSLGLGSLETEGDGIALELG